MEYYLSDIVGFTTICSSSTPLEVVNMLNGIYTKFDDVISKNQAYKILKTFEIPHRRNSRLRIRIGYNSGSVAAGVVGLTAPRYCLFGDTVNMASRMESTSEPEKIQISENANDMLRRYYPEFITELRGTVDVKGKGACNTYWLLGKEEHQSLKHDEARKYL
ncbi:unnamed protein product [Angiostrongylus costaricensis]|uniref:Guanylate cyclase domain-containing protein n=1 Tax=Angiostrongylus costaricensis TaxID=334426 RepID=A0A0R3PHU8_ANGCS|nr:unnamed protein product [Angiostrongylus costaricensis]